MQHRLYDVHTANSGLCRANVVGPSHGAKGMIATAFASKKTIGTLTAFAIILGADLGTAVAAIVGAMSESGVRAV